LYLQIVVASVVASSRRYSSE